VHVINIMFSVTIHLCILVSDIVANKCCVLIVMYYHMNTVLVELFLQLLRLACSVEKRM